MRDISKKINTIYNLIILDESGSMHGLEKMSVDGVNETIQTIKSAAEANPEQKQMFSFLTFSGMRPNERPYRVHTLLSEISRSGYRAFRYRRLIKPIKIALRQA